MFTPMIGNLISEVVLATALTLGTATLPQWGRVQEPSTTVVVDSIVPETLPPLDLFPPHREHALQSSLRFYRPLARDRRARAPVRGSLSWLGGLAFLPFTFLGRGLRFLQRSLLQQPLQQESHRRTPFVRAQGLDALRSNFFFERAVTFRRLRRYSLALSELTFALRPDDIFETSPSPRMIAQSLLWTDLWSRLEPLQQKNTWLRFSTQTYHLDGLWWQMKLNLPKWLSNLKSMLLGSTITGTVDEQREIIQNIRDLLNPLGIVIESTIYLDLLRRRFVVT